MLTTAKTILPAFALLTYFLPIARATVTLHYFAHTSCNANTALSEYTTPAAASGDGSCHAAPDGTVAIYVDGIDQGCTVRTYSDAECGTVMGLSIGVGTCYYSAENVTIPSWKIVCGAVVDSMDAASMSVTSMVPTTDSASASGDTATATGVSITATGSTSSGMTMAVSAQITATVTTAPSATGPVCNGNCTWTNQLGPTNHTPSFQTGGPQVHTGEAEAINFTGWRKHVLKGLVAMGAAETLWALL